MSRPEHRIAFLAVREALCGAERSTANIVILGAGKAALRDEEDQYLKDDSRWYSKALCPVGSTNVQILDTSLEEGETLTACNFASGAVVSPANAAPADTVRAGR